MPPDTTKKLYPVALMAAVLLVLIGATVVFSGHSSQKQPAPGPPPASPETSGAAGVELSEAQLHSLRIEPAAERSFLMQKEAIGSIGFDENMSVSVFSPYPGKVIEAFVQVGDEVKKNQTLFTIESPDLIQAESTLISAAGVYDMTTQALARAKELLKTQGIAQKDFDQAASDQQTADGALRAARSAVRVFGKTDAEINRIIATRKIDPALSVQSPIKGRITARNAATGLLVQPGVAPAPYSVADVSSMWMLANVTESESPFFHVGQEVKVRVTAYPNKVFKGKISTIGATVDSNTHRVLLRSDIQDPRHELRPGMFATFVISTGNVAKSVAVPEKGVVREGDGTMTVWVTVDRKHFMQRAVKVGMQQNGYDQILDGLKAGELIVTENAVFLSNMNNTDSQ